VSTNHVTRVGELGFSESQRWGGRGRLGFSQSQRMWAWTSKWMAYYCQYSSGDKIENEMGDACSAYGGEQRRIQGFSGET